MMRPSLIRAGFLGLILTLFMLAIACGGGGGGTTPPTQIAVSISPTSAVVPVGTTQQFTATVTGTTNTSVTWTVDPQVGTLTTSASAATYTAPAANSLPVPRIASLVSTEANKQTPGVNVALAPLVSSDVVTVTATSQADTTKSATATVTIVSLSVIALGTCDNVQCVTSGGPGVEVKQGGTATLFLVGYGIAFGDSYTVSGNSSDVVVTRPSESQYVTTNTGEPAVYFDIAVSPSASVGVRNLMATNPNGELATYVGGLKITPGH